MKKNNCELMRIQTTLENDRLSVGNAFIELLTNDLQKLLKDYFIFNDEISVQLLKGKDGYGLQIALDILRIKSVNTILN